MIGLLPVAAPQFSLVGLVIMGLVLLAVVAGGAFLAWHAANNR